MSQFDFFNYFFEGGENIFVDGLKAAQVLQQKKPKQFHDLTQIHTTFHKYGTDHSMIYR